MIPGDHVFASLFMGLAPVEVCITELLGSASLDSTPSLSPSVFFSPLFRFLSSLLPLHLQVVITLLPSYCSGLSCECFLFLANACPLLSNEDWYELRENY